MVGAECRGTIVEGEMVALCEGGKLEPSRGAGGHLSEMKVIIRAWEVVLRSRPGVDFARLSQKAPR
jgi:hypothetical protein